MSEAITSTNDRQSSAYDAIMAKLRECASKFSRERDGLDLKVNSSLNFCAMDLWLNIYCSLSGF